MDRLRASFAGAALVTGASLAWLASDWRPAPTNVRLSSPSVVKSFPEPFLFYPESAVRCEERIVPVAFEFDPPPAPQANPALLEPRWRAAAPTNAASPSRMRPGDKRHSVDDSGSDAPAQRPAPQVRRAPPTEESISPTNDTFTLHRNPAPSRTPPTEVEDISSDHKTIEPSQGVESPEQATPIESAPRRPHAIPVTPADMEAITQRAESLIEKAISLGQRGAVYSARSELLHALKLVAQAQDSQEQSSRRSESLMSGLRALEEAEDFLPQGDELDADLTMLVQAHRTPVLKNMNLRGATSFGAMQQYFTYAQEKIAEAGGDVPAASHALHTLGKLQAAMSPDGTSATSLQTPRAMALYQAAMMVDPNNHLAANELGVLLARNNQLPDARRVLLHSLSIHPTGEAWHNLAVVHDRLGETSLARQASQEGQRVATQSGGSNLQSDPVQWVRPEAFASRSPEPTTDITRATTGERATVATAPGRQADAPWWKWWQKLPR